MEERPSQHDTVAVIEHGLRQVLDRGLIAARLVECAFPQLRAVDCRVESPGPYGAAYALERLLRDVLATLGDGPYGQAVRLLFGAVAGTRGLPRKDRRRQAADMLNVMPSTFRQNYEDAILRDVAVEILRLELATPNGVNGHPEALAPQPG